METLTGILFGANVAAAVFLYGPLIQGRLRRSRPTPPPASPPEQAAPLPGLPNELEEKRQKLLDEQRAFETLMNYNVDVAYNIGGKK